MQMITLKSIISCKFKRQTQSRDTRADGGVLIVACLNRICLSIMQLTNKMTGMQIWALQHCIIPTFK